MAAKSLVIRILILQHYHHRLIALFVFMLMGSMISSILATLAPLNKPKNRMFSVFVCVIVLKSLAFFGFFCVLICLLSGFFLFLFFVWFLWEFDWILNFSSFWKFYGICFSGFVLLLLVLCCCAVNHVKVWSFFFYYFYWILFLQFYCFFLNGFHTWSIFAIDLDCFNVFIFFAFWCKLMLLDCWNLQYIVCFLNFCVFVYIWI